MCFESPKCIKCIFSWDSTPDHAGRNYITPPHYPLDGFGGRCKGKKVGEGRNGEGTVNKGEETEKGMHWCNFGGGRLLSGAERGCTLNLPRIY